MRFSPLPTDAIDRLFQIMEATYLNRFAVTWQGVDIPAAKRQWCAELGKLRNSELKRGVDLLTSVAWPPNLSEFFMMCRPEQDFESTYREACEQMRLREDGRDVWTSPAVYWAAIKFGQYELKSLTYSQAAKRWARCLTLALEFEPMPPVPEKLLALPSAGRSTVTQEVNRERMAKLKKAIFNLTGASE